MGTFSLRRLAGWLMPLSLCVLAGPVLAQSFQVQCPEATAMHPLVGGAPNPNIKCQQISGGDGFTTMADGTQMYLFAFGPLSGLKDIIAGLPGTQPASVFNADNTGVAGLNIGAPVPGITFNGAVGMIPDPEVSGDPACSTASPPGYCSTGLNGHVDPRLIMNVGTLNGSFPAPLMALDEDDEFFLTLSNVGQIMRPDLFEQHTVHFHGYPNASAFYDGVPDASVAINIGASFTYYYLAPDAGTYLWHCHITPPEHLEMGMVGQIYVRPRQNRVIGDLYTALQALNAPPAVAASPTTAEYERLRQRCNGDILCSNPLPATNTYASNDGTRKYAYNDGDGSTYYDVEYPIQMHGFDPNFHFVGMTFNPETFVDLKEKYFLLNGRSYPDTINPAAISTKSADNVPRYAQSMRALVNIPSGGRALLRLSDLNVSEFHTLASLGIRMKVIGINAKLLRDQAGNNMYYDTNSITLGGGESLDVILDACKARAGDGSCSEAYPPGRKFYLYTPQLDHLSNDAENFGGMMTEVNICSAVDPQTKTCT